MGFLRCAKNINDARVPTSPWQIEFRLFSGNVDNVHVTADDPDDELAAQRLRAGWRPRLWGTDEAARVPTSATGQKR
jgi:hypothetical protein